MHGQPVWLASLSRTTKSGRIVATGDWTLQQRREGQRLLRQAVKDVGDPSRERLFRMNLTLCLHRACTDAEVAGLPDSWHKGAPGMAGGPVEVVWQTVPQTPSCQPCQTPRRDVIEPSRPDLWVPQDCGKCLPCQARAAIRAQYDIPNTPFEVRL